MWHDSIFERWPKRRDVLARNLWGILFEALSKRRKEATSDDFNDRVGRGCCGRRASDLGPQAKERPVPGKKRTLGFRV